MDLLPNSPDINMSCYMSDDEPLALLPTAGLTSPIGGSVNVLDMINQDVMFGNSSSATTEVTYVRTAPCTSAGDVILPPSPTTIVAKDAKPMQAYVPPKSSKRRRNTKTKTKPTTASLVSGFTPCQTQSSSNLFEDDPKDTNQMQMVKNPFATKTSKESKKDRNTSKIASSSSKKSKCKTHDSDKSPSPSSSKSPKKTSRSCSKTKKVLVISPMQRKGPTPILTVGEIAVSTDSHTVTHTTTHTVTRTTNIATESTVALTAGVVSKTAGTLQASEVCSLTSTVTSVSVTVADSTRCTAATSELTTTSSVTSNTVKKTRAPVSIISPLRSTYQPSKVQFSTPTIITRTPPAAASSVGGKVCEQYTILPAPAQYTIPANADDLSAEGSTTRTRTRLMIPVSLSTFVTSVTTNTTTASTTCKHRTVHAVRPFLSQTIATVAQAQTTATTNTTTVAGHTFSQGSFTLPPGAALYTARRFTRSYRPAVTTESRTFTILDSKGMYTTVTFSPDFEASTSGRWNQTHTTPATTTSAVSNTCISSETARPRSQIVIPITNSQMNTNSSLSYLVTSSIASPVGTTTQSPTTTIASHTITTISSETFNRIRSRLMYNVPRTTTGLNLSSSTFSADGSRTRGPVTIIANQLISGPRSDSAASNSAFPADPAARPFNRVVIPIMSNVHVTSAGHSLASTQGKYIIAGVNQSTTTDTVTRPARVIPTIINNTGGTIASTTTTAVMSGSKPSPAVGSCTSSGIFSDTYSKLRNRLTIQVSANDSPTARTTSPTAYTITRTRAPQNVYTIPAGPTPYISATKTSEAARNSATMTLITFSPPRTASGVSAVGSPHRLSAAASSGSPSNLTSITTATPTLASTGNRFVIKLATSTSAASNAGVSTMTTSITTPMTTAAVNLTEHRFVEPHPPSTVSTRFRTFPGPRTYSVAQRTAPAAVATASLRPVTRPVTPRVRKVITNPAPLQIFADVVCPPSSSQTQTRAPTPTTFKSRFTLSHTSGNSTLVVPQYKNTVFKNLSTVAHPSPERMGPRLMGPRASSERLVLNRSVAFVSPRRQTPESSAVAQETPSVSQRQTRSPYPDTRSQTDRTSDTSPAPNAP